jgi:uncharacterized membrane protein
MSESKQEQSVVAIYDTHAEAEAAVKELEKAGLDMKRLSIVGKDFYSEEHALGFYTLGDRMKFLGGRGAIWGSLWGMLFGGAIFFIPAIGPIVAMGPLVGWIVGALEGAAVGATAGVVAAALTGIGLPSESVVKYDINVKAGRFLVLAMGSAEMIEHAHAVLDKTGSRELDTHSL